MKYARSLTTTRPQARLALAAALAATLLAACSGAPDAGKPAASATPALADGGPTVATVNGQPITQKMLDALALTRGGDANNPQVREKLVKQLTDTMVLVEAAKKEGLEKDPEFAAAAELARLQGIATAASRYFQKSVQVDDAAVKAEYDQQVAKGGSIEYDFSQIVFTEKDKADKAAAEIAKGKSFDKLMEQYNKDKDKDKDVRIARNYPKVRAAQLPPPMASALAALKPNESSKTAVQLPQGWAIFNLKSATTVPPPAFDQMKEGLRRTLARRLGEERIAKLRQEANVTIAPPPPGAAPATPPTTKPAATPPKTGS